MRTLFFILALTFTLPLLSENIPRAYITQFSGDLTQEMRTRLNEASQMIKLKDHPPKTEAALLRRAELDIPNLVKALHSLAYYNAKVDFTALLEQTPQIVTYHIEADSLYPLAGVEVLPHSLQITQEDLGLSLGKPAYPKDIFSAEENLIYALEKMGYPLAKLKERDVIADQKTKRIFLKITVDPGPLARFGVTTIEGNVEVNDNFIGKKIEWRYGARYDPEKISKTMNGLEAAGVFSSINITHADTIQEDGTLPMIIQVSEGKQRSIGLGIGFSTQRGPGFMAEWEHRNFGGYGERLRVNANVLKETQEGYISYLIPDYFCHGQDLISKFEVEHDDTKGYEKTSFALSEILERQISPRLSISYGGMYEYLRTTEEKESGKKTTESFNLARVPLKLRWSTVDNLLDPTRGSTIFIKAIPTFQLVQNPFVYTITNLTASTYYPLRPDGRWVLAGKVSFGSIWGSSRDTIPGSDRFYAGSENTLRGYNYYTVSPLSDDLDPIGGRSLMIYTLESRTRWNDTWGNVLFYDVGNVYSSPLPRFDDKMLQSAGIGIRYYTAVGPLRLDIAFPLNRRKAFDQKAKKKKYVDDPFQIYFSIGQSF